MELFSNLENMQQFKQLISTVAILWPCDTLPTRQMYKHMSQLFLSVSVPPLFKNINHEKQQKCWEEHSTYALSITKTAVNMNRQPALYLLREIRKKIVNYLFQYTGFLFSEVNLSEAFASMNYFKQSTSKKVYS
jgi:hypothetical protein